ncbi:MAG: DNA polymerase III subunit delta' [bacterium]
MSVWGSLIGQADTVAVLRAAAEAGRVVVAGHSPTEADAPPEGGGTHSSTVGSSAMTHAWLFTGPPGSGRSVAARALAAALQCTQAAPDGPGCGHCPGCHTTLAGTHPDVQLITPEGLSIGVGEMRAVVARAARRPALGRWQVMLIEDADRLTEDASNALLKAVEEPPPRTVFLLCAPSDHPDDVSVTIRSRCRSVSLRTPPAVAIAAVLEAEGEPGESAALWAQAAQGHVGRARRLARDPQARARRSAVLAIPASLRSVGACFGAADHLLSTADLEASAQSDVRDSEETEALKVALGAGGTGKGAAAVARGSAGAVKELERRQRSRATRARRDALDRALVDLAAFYRDALLVQTGSSVPVAHPDARRDVATVAAALTPTEVLGRLDAVLACREAIDLNVKPRIAVEAMTMALRLP